MSVGAFDGRCGDAEPRRGHIMGRRNTLLTALRGLHAHRLSSALTMFSLIIGVSAVILLVACGYGVKNSIDARVETVANAIAIVPTTAGRTGGPPHPNRTDSDHRYIVGYGRGAGNTLNEITVQATQQAAVPAAIARSAASSMPATTSPTPACETSKFNPWETGWKPSTRSCTSSSCSFRPSR